MNLVSSVVGYPYIGENREWKKVTESYWKDSISQEEFQQQMKQLRIQNLKKQQSLNLDNLTVGDFTYYDRMLDLSVMFGLVPKRYGWKDEKVDLSTYYAMARGANEVVACEMTKWFNTNYHYIVPEYEGLPLRLTQNTILTYFLEAKEELGLLTKPTLIGPFTFIQLTKGYDEKSKVEFILRLLPLYAQVIKELVNAGAQWIQLEEPALTATLTDDDIRLVEEIYQQLVNEVPAAKLMLQTYFEALSNYERLVNLPVSGIGLDFVHGYEENFAALGKYGFPQEKLLAIGIINGRDIWRANLAEKASTVQALLKLANTDTAWITSSCSLQHVPVTKKCEQQLEEVLKNALSFADEKVTELQQLVAYLVDSKFAGNTCISESIKAIEELNQHTNRKRESVAQQLLAVSEHDYERPLSFKERQVLQKAALQLPDYPTTTIGSFPQSATVKRTRTAWRKKDISDAQYAQFIEEETARWIQIQEEIGLDVFVHGEFERTDMVEYFGEKLAGFAFTQNAWVVSYGSRCVKPPVIFGDVEWIAPMTVKEVVEAQQKATKPVKGMLTGPVTILNWSFVRDDISRAKVANQIALALRREIQQLEKAGIKIIQVDEPALREGLPLREKDWSSYLDWSTKAFKLATSQVANTTQVHTHMCYCEFNDFIGPIRALDADVISIETSRSHGELIDSLKENSYELGIGLGVYDIHSPRVPKVEEMSHILQESMKVIPKEQFWVNPDCGLKTRGETETVAALKTWLRQQSCYALSNNLFNRQGHKLM